MRSVISDGDRSRVVADLFEREIQNRERGMYERAMLLEDNAESRAESKQWEILGSCNKILFNDTYGVVVLNQIRALDKKLIRKQGFVISFE